MRGCFNMVKGEGFYRCGVVDGDSTQSKHSAAGEKITLRFDTTGQKCNVLKKLLVGSLFLDLNVKKLIQF